MGCFKHWLLGITIDWFDNRTLDLRQRAVTLMTWLATEGHANPFPQPESMSQQRATEVVTSTFFQKPCQAVY